jgi:hypothetical protein
VHSIDEAIALLKDIPEIKITATHLVSIRWVPDNVYGYEAPAMVIEPMQPGDGSVLMSKVVGVAKAWNQNRFFFEDYESGETVALAKGWKSKVVEAWS